MTLFKRAEKPIGDKGEGIAAKFLRKEGLEVLAVNYWAKAGEIDIVAEDAGTLVFVEVKTRSSEGRGMPEEAINLRKIRKLTRLAQRYIKTKALSGKKARFDVVSILIKERSSDANIKLIKNAFYIEE